MASAMGAFKINRIDLGQRYELLQVYAFAGLGFQRLQLGFGEAHVLAFRELVTAHEIITLDHHITHGAVVAVSDS